MSRNFYDTGETYTLHSEMFQKFGFNNIVENDYPNHYSKLTWKVINKPTPRIDFKDRMLVGIESNEGHQLVIQVEGIQKVKK